MTTQTATLPQSLNQNGRNLTPQKELMRALSLVATDGAGMPQEVIAARWYMARRSDGASRVYCSIWIRDRTLHGAGNGFASGFGYHKPSAALQAAIESTGITLAEPIDGHGDRAMEDALEAIARTLGYTHMTIIAHH